MKGDAFSGYHPAVNLLFFIGAVCFGVFLQHPVYLLTGLCAAGSYYLLLNGRRGWRMLAGLLPLFLFITLFNPVINTRGMTVLFLLFGRPYTLEALIYGVAVAATFTVTVLWCGCAGKVLTGDKFTCLLGNIMPSTSMLLVMVFRMLPRFLRKLRQISRVRTCVGKGVGATASLREKLAAGGTVLGSLTSWALEGSVVTGDSMRARGYGTAKRSAFMIYRMTPSDWIVSAVMLATVGVVIGFAAAGGMSAVFLPERSIASVRGANLIGFFSYAGYLFIPVFLHIKEVIQWNSSRSGI